MSKNSNKAGERRGLFDILASRTSLPSDALAGEFRIEMRGRHTLYLQGCRRILKYSREEMKMAAKGFSVSVRGRELICTTYHDGTVTVDGLVTGILFDTDVEES